MNVIDCAVPVNGTAAALDLDLEAAREHLRLLDPTANSFIFAAFPEATDARGYPFQRRASLDEVWLTLVRLQAKGYGIFVAINEMRGERRKCEDVVRIRTVHGDFDKPPTSQPSLEPSLVIRTSQLLPGQPKHQAWWFTEVDDNVTGQEAKAVNKSIVLRHGADDRAADIARVLRLAGTYHLKREPHLVGIVGGNRRRYTRRELLEAFPSPPPPPRTSAPTRFLDRPGSVGRLIAPLRVIPANDYGTWVDVGMALHCETNGSADGLSLWDAWSSASEKYRPGECAKRWQSFGRTDAVITGGTIIYLARQHGWHASLRGCDAQ